ncbi:hypothetical protein JKP88DRAFT_302753 [Tribonema minus]|uniref:Calmodulin n=1 Tax=Tribonema minus TaxID=303371 RepID=A0A836CJN6_9STRA|nr:hypothetical protein JKP88DRAFT_302753 [Tribonema minus]
MYVWQGKNRRCRRGRGRQKPGDDEVTTELDEKRKHIASLREAEQRRRAMEDAYVEHAQDRMAALLALYLKNSSEGKEELAEVAQNLKNWKAANAVLDAAAGGPPRDATHDSDEDVPLSDGGIDNASGTRAAAGSPRSAWDVRRRRKAREIFEMFDADGSATIDAGEMRELMNELCIPLEDDELVALMQEIDTDQSGEIDFEEFYVWYRDHAAEAQIEAIGATAGLFASKMVNAISGLTLRMEAQRVIIAHAQAQVDERVRAAFRRSRPPQFACLECGDAYETLAELKAHKAEKESNHQAYKAALEAAQKRFFPAACILSPPPVPQPTPDGEVERAEDDKRASNYVKVVADPILAAVHVTMPHHAADAVQSRRARLRRLIYSSNFYTIFGAELCGKDDMANDTTDYFRLVNKEHPQLADPSDHRGAQLRRGQAVEGHDPALRRLASPHYWGDLYNCHALLRLSQAKAASVAPSVHVATNQFDERAAVTFRYAGPTKTPVMLFANFNGWRGQQMVEDTSPLHLTLPTDRSQESVANAQIPQTAHTLTVLLPPGVYCYYYVRDGVRQLDAGPKFSGNAEAGGECNVALVVNAAVGSSACALQALATNAADSDNNASRNATTIDLTRHWICDDGAWSLAAALAGNAAGIQALQNALGDDGTEAVASSLHGHPAIAFLSLASNSMHEDGAAAVAHLLRRCRPLRALVLSSNALSRAAVDRLATALRRNAGLTCLDLSNNPLESAGLMALSTCIGVNDSLLELKLGGCDLQAGGDMQGIAAVCQALTVNRAITRIDLQANDLGEFAAQCLARALAHSQHNHVQHLDLTGNNAISPAWLYEGPAMETEMHHGIPTIATSLAAARKLALHATGTALHAPRLEDVQHAVAAGDDAASGGTPPPADRRRSTVGHHHRRSSAAGYSAWPANAGTADGELSDSSRDSAAQEEEELKVLTGVKLEAARERKAAQAERIRARAEAKATDAAGTAARDETTEFLESPDGKKLVRLVAAKLQQDNRECDALMRRLSKKAKRREQPLNNASATIALPAQQELQRSQNAATLPSNTSTGDAPPGDMEATLGMTATLGSEAWPPEIPGADANGQRTAMLRGHPVPDNVLSAAAAVLGCGRGSYCQQLLLRQHLPVSLMMVDAPEKPAPNQGQLAVGKAAVAKRQAEVQDQARVQQWRDARRQQVINAFRKYDPEGRGVMDAEHLQGLLLQLCLPQADVLTPPHQRQALPQLQGLLLTLPGSIKTTPRPGSPTSSTTAAGTLAMTAVAHTGSSNAVHDVAVPSANQATGQAASLQSGHSSLISTGHAHAHIGTPPTRRATVQSVCSVPDGNNTATPVSVQNPADGSRRVSVISAQRLNPDGRPSTASDAITSGVTATASPRSSMTVRRRSVMSVSGMYQRVSMRAATPISGPYARAAMPPLPTVPAAVVQPARQPWQVAAAVRMTKGAGGDAISLAAFWTWYKDVGMTDECKPHTLTHLLALKAAARRHYGELPTLEVGISSRRRLDEHQKDMVFHNAYRALAARMDYLADVIETCTRDVVPMTYPDYYQVARSLPGETELPVYQAADTLSRPLGNVTCDMTIEALAHDGQWMQINFKGHKGVWVRYKGEAGVLTGGGGILLTRMPLPPRKPAAAAKIQLQALRMGLRRLKPGLEPPEPPSLDVRAAGYSPHVIRYPGPVPFRCSAGAPEGVRLKIRSNPSGDAQVLGFLSHEEGVMASAEAGDWLQVQYNSFPAGWLLRTYRGQQMVEPLEIYTRVVTSPTGAVMAPAWAPETSPFMLPDDLVPSYGGPAGEVLQLPVISTRT